MRHSFDGMGRFTDVRSGKTYGPYKAPFSFTIKNPFVRKSIASKEADGVGSDDSTKKYRVDEVQSSIYGEGELRADELSGLPCSISGFGHSETSTISRVNLLPVDGDEARLSIGWHSFISETHIILDIFLPTLRLESIVEEITDHPETDINVYVTSDMYRFGVLSNKNWHVVGAELKLLTKEMEFEDVSEQMNLDYFMSKMNFLAGPAEVRVDMVRCLRSSPEAASDDLSKEHAEKDEIASINSALEDLRSEIRTLTDKHETLQSAYTELSSGRSRRRW